MKTISVVVPVYNVEKYLKECLDSIIHQTYKDLQIILIDDGSTDSSGSICDEYAIIDNRITVVHQVNQGAGAAKNTGLELINGDYFVLLDSDDYIELDMLEIMMNQMIYHRVDIVQCLFLHEAISGSLQANYVFQRKKMRKISPSEFLYEMLFDWKYALFWNKLFKRDMLKCIRFPQDRKIDDEFFTYKLIGNSASILCIDNCFYHYRMRKTGVMNGNTKYRLITDRVESFEERYEFIAKRFPSLKKDFYKHLSEYIDYELIHTEDIALIEYLNKKHDEYPLKKPPIMQRIKMRIKLATSNKTPKNRNLDIMEYYD